jgi:hypothetical protein
MLKRSNSHALLRATDGLMAVVLAVAAAAWANQQRMPQGGLEEFLEMRVTLLNASFSIVFAVLWQQCMEALGLYRRFAGLFRLTTVTAAGVGVMTALLALYLEARRAQGPVPRILITFFVVAFSYQMASSLAADAGRPRPGGNCASSTTVPNTCLGSWMIGKRARCRRISQAAFWAVLMTFPLTFFATPWTSLSLRCQRAPVMT